MSDDQIIDQTTSCTLRVTPDGHVVMTKSIPYDGVLRYTTDEEPTLRSRRKRSEDRLAANTVIERYLNHANTGATFQELARDVLDAIGERRTARLEVSAE